VWTLSAGGPDWTPITPKTGSLFHAETHLQQHLPDAQLYPDANHGSQYQRQQAFVGHVAMFLDA
jgi:hypothetical protein